MSEPTVLDTLKDTTLRSINLIEAVQDSVAGSLCGMHDDDVEILDTVKRTLLDAVAVHVRGVRAEYPHFTEAGYNAIHTYDDGSAVLELIELRDSSVATFFPRHDGDRDVFISKLSAGLRPDLTIVEGSK